jgi:hypothetical protein
MIEVRLKGSGALIGVYYGPALVAAAIGNGRMKLIQDYYPRVPDVSRSALHAFVSDDDVKTIEVDVRLCHVVPYGIGSVKPVTVEYPIIYVDNERQMHHVHGYVDLRTLVRY